MTFDTVGAEAGYSRNLAFQKFGSKSALLEAVIDHLHNMAEQARHDAGLDTLPGLAAVQAFCDAQFRAHRDTEIMRAYSILLGSAVSELSETLLLFENEHKKIGRTLKALFQRGLGDGSIREDVDATLASIVVGTQLLGISTQSIVVPGFRLDDALEEFKNVIARAYGTKQRI